jgi:hypothetical protein
MKTILLDATKWDLVLDVSGNIAVADDPYAKAQDVASAERLFKGELWYNTTLGIDYFGLILGKSPSLALLKNYWNTAAKRVPGVVTAKSFISSFQNREIRGQVQITDDEGNTTVVAVRQVVPAP